MSSHRNRLHERRAVAERLPSASEAINAAPPRPAHGVLAHGPSASARPGSAGWTAPGTGSDPSRALRGKLLARQRAQGCCRAGRRRGRGSGARCPRTGPREKHRPTGERLTRPSAGRSDGPGGGSSLQSDIAGAHEAGTTLDAAHRARHRCGQSAFRLAQGDAGERPAPTALRQLVGRRRRRPSLSLPAVVSHVREAASARPPLASAQPATLQPPGETREPAGQTAKACWSTEAPMIRAISEVTTVLLTDAVEGRVS